MALMCPKKCWMSWLRFKVQNTPSGNDARPSLSVDYAWLIALSILFGLSFTLTSIGVRDIPPISLAAGRLLLAFLMLYPLMRLNGQRMPGMGPIWIALLGSGLFGNALPFALISWGQVTVQAGLTAIFMAVMPLATILLAHVFTDDEKLDRWKVLGVLFGLLGVIVLMGFSALNSLGDDLLRQSAILAAAVCYAINAIITRKLTKLPRWSAMTALMVAGCLWLVPVSLWLESPWQVVPSMESVWSMIALAIGPTAIATVMILRIIDRQGASFLSQINFLVPVVGMVFGVLMLGERFPANAYVALAIILLGIALSRLGGRRL